MIVAWAIFYSVYPINLSWGSDPEGILFNDHLELADIPGTFGGLVPWVVIPLAMVWIVVLGISFKSAKRGIDIANRIMIPTLLVVFLLIVIQTVTYQIL